MSRARDLSAQASLSVQRRLNAGQLAFPVARTVDQGPQQRAFGITAHRRGRRNSSRLSIVAVGRSVGHRHRFQQLRA